MPCALAVAEIIEVCSVVAVVGLVGASCIVIVLNPADLSELPANVLLHLRPEILLLLLPDGQEVFVADRVGAISGVRDAGVRVGPVNLELAEDACTSAGLGVLGVLAISLLVVLPVVGLGPGKLLLLGGAVHPDVAALCQDLLVTGSWSWGWRLFCRRGCWGGWCLFCPHGCQGGQGEEDTQGHASDQSRQRAPAALSRGCGLQCPAWRRCGATGNGAGHKGKAAGDGDQRRDSEAARHGFSKRIVGTPSDWKLACLEPNAIKQAVQMLSAVASFPCITLTFPSNLS